MAVTRFADEHDESTRLATSVVAPQRMDDALPKRAAAERFVRSARLRVLSRENIVAASNTAMTEAMQSRATEPCSTAFGGPGGDGYRQG